MAFHLFNKRQCLLPVVERTILAHAGGVVFGQSFEDEEGIITEDELCECCGENRRDKHFGESYPYCADCREAMSRYPFSWYNVVVALALVVLSVVSCITFFGDFDGYYAAYNAKKAHNNRELASAVSNYENAIAIFDEEDINAKKLHLDCAEALYDSMPQGIVSMTRISELISDAFTDFEAKLPIYKNYVDLHDKVMVLYGTMEKFYVVINNAEYTDFEDEKIYTEAMTAIGKILDEEIQVKKIDGSGQNTYPADESIVRFCQFMFAYTAGRYEDSYQYMRQVAEDTPDYLWLYAYELGVVDSQTGNYKEARALAKKMHENNVEDYGAYCVYSCTERVAGNLDKAILWADKGIEKVPDNAEIRRHKAMALVVTGELEAAEKLLEETLVIEENGLLNITLLVVENELGKKETVAEIKDYLEENEIEIPQRTQDYLSGKLTAEELFGEGTGDIE